MAKLEVKKVYKSKSKQLSGGHIYRHKIDSTCFCALIWIEGRSSNEQFYFESDTGKTAVLSDTEAILPEFLERVDLDRESGIVFWTAWQSAKDAERNRLIRPTISRIVELLKLLNIKYKVDLNSDLIPKIIVDSETDFWSADYQLSENSDFHDVQDILQTLENKLEKENAAQLKISKAKAAFDALPLDVKRYLKDMQLDRNFGASMAIHISRMAT